MKRIAALAVALSVVLVSIRVVNSQTSDTICSFDWYGNTACDAHVPCVDEGVLDGKAIAVPGNVTRISRQGLSVCKEDVEGEPVDIIFIVDNSGSMHPNGGAYVQTDGQGNPTDTLFYYSSSCLNGGTSGTITVRFHDGFKALSRLRSQCSQAAAGDPNGQRGLIMERALEVTLDNSPVSYVGYLKFGGSITDQQQPVDIGTRKYLLDARVNALVDDIMALDDDGGTNYREVIGRAIEWIENQGLTPHGRNAIVFLSDGNPTSGQTVTSSQIQALQDNDVPVYGIYLAFEGSGTALQDLADGTGGEYYIIPPDRPDSMIAVTERIVATLTKSFRPEQFKVTNTRNGASAVGVSYSAAAEGWAALMDSVIALLPGQNQVRVEAVFTMVESGATFLDTVEFTFTVNVAGPPDPQCYACWGRTTLDVLNADGEPVDTLSWRDDSYIIRLTYHGIDSLASTVVRVLTQKGDAEAIVLENPVDMGGYWVFEKTVPLHVLAGTQPAQSGNGETEANASDTISLSWKHPRDDRDSVSKTVRVSAPPDTVKMYGSPGDPAGKTPFASPPQVDTLVAGATTDLYAKVFGSGNWLSDYENDPSLASRITWSLTSSATGLADTTLARLTGASGAHTGVFPLKAYQHVDITARLALGYATLNATARFFIKPGAAAQVVIEATDDSSKSDLNSPRPYDPIVLQKTSGRDTAYAILRDSLGNWVGPAQGPAWGSLDPGIVAATALEPLRGQAAVVKTSSSVLSEETRIYVVSGGLTDTVTVRTLEYDIDSLRVVVITRSDTTDITSLSMNSNQDTTLVVLGRRDDTGEWIPVDAEWSINPRLTEQNPPAAAPQWTFSPLGPGQGTVSASYGDKLDQISFNFSIGPPVQATFEVITPDSGLVAGDTIVAVVSIRNEDGLVPGTWCYPGTNGAVSSGDAAYFDTLGNGGLIFRPVLITLDGGAVRDTGHLDDTARVGQCFSGGIDTVKVVLYYAPADRTPHVLTVNLVDDGHSVWASTDPFVLKPAQLDSIAIDPASIDTLDPGDAGFVVRAIAIDRFGNVIPNEKFLWESDSSLVDYDISVQTPQIYFDPGRATTDQGGYLVVSSVDHPGITNRVLVNIRAPRAELTVAVTRDLNGNGYLDAIELYFDKRVTFLEAYLRVGVTVEISVEGKVVSFTIDSVSPSNATSAVFTLYLREDTLTVPKTPQTDWQPDISIPATAQTEAVVGLKATDGAGPVIWKVTNKVSSADDRTRDKVTVEFSESILEPDGSPFTPTNVPSSLFNVWRWDEANGAYVLDDSVLVGIDNFAEVVGGNTLVFYMTNGEELTSEHFLSIRTEPEALIGDAVQNIPNGNNHKVDVKVIGTLGNIKVGPNPMWPTFSHFQEELKSVDPREAYSWAKNEGGAVMVAEINLPSDNDGTGGANVRVTGALLVFDAVGNQVYRRDNANDLIPPAWRSDWVGGVNRQLVFYWNGITDRNMKAAPGVYRSVLFVSWLNQERKYIGNIGIGR